MKISAAFVPIVGVKELGVFITRLVQFQGNCHGWGTPPRSRFTTFISLCFWQCQKPRLLQPFFSGVRPLLVLRKGCYPTKPKQQSSCWPRMGSTLGICKGSLLVTLLETGGSGETNPTPDGRPGGDSAQFIPASGCLIRCTILFASLPQSTCVIVFFLYCLQHERKLGYSSSLWFHFSWLHMFLQRVT